MRAPFLLLPLAFTTLASMPAVAQYAPRVIFCMGSCFAVDQNGVRTPAPKGTTLREGQRLETGPNAYAQLKLGPDAAVGVGERAQVRFDQTSLRDRDIVILDQGRIRMVGGEALGKAATRGVELRTFDGIFALRNADIEVKTPPPLAGGTDASLTVVKLNAGDARLLNPQGDIAIARDGVQGFTAGKIVTDKPISLADVALAPSRPGVATIAPAAPVSTPFTDIPALTLTPPVLLPAPTLTVIPLSPSITSVAPPTIVPLAPVVSSADRVLLTPVVNPASPTTTTTLTKVVTGTNLAPATTTTATTSPTAPTNSTIFLTPITTTTLTAPSTLRLCRIPPC
jgi:hypothetical protein